MGFTDIDYAYILLFVSGLLLVEGLYHLAIDMRRGENGGRNRRMRLLAAGAAGDAALNRLRRGETDRLSAAIIRALPITDRLIRESGLTISVRRFAAICVSLVVLALLALRFAAGLAPLPSLLGALALGIGGPMLALGVRGRLRIAKIVLQFPEALEMMVRCLKAGHPIGSAIGMIATEMPDPIGTEFGLVVDEMTYGLDLHSALVNLAARVPNPDLRYFVVTVQIQHNTGGNLGEALGNLATVIRDRFAMKAKVKALTSQGRSSAFIIGLMPLVSAAAINVINKGYFGDVMTDPLFMPGMVVAGVLMAIGHLIIHRLVNFRI
ncbi:type II secretion system F family protein [Azospirillum canadense]|uniref:type II secretion system F family protein n=1 Tax=Azospirillum canadense TaxID=403962 RepID=UPI002227FA4E|nr:type II secretion system F family protein [Azospirillum canadense]MCW2238711.1 tight adherence protein B [Azospirillum canadense]